MTFRSIRSVAGELGISQRLVRRAIRRGSIPAVEIAGSWRIPGSYFEELEARAYARAGRQVQEPWRLGPEAERLSGHRRRLDDDGEDPDAAAEMDIEFYQEEPA